MDRGDTHHYALSGSAEARVLAAMAAAMGEQASMAIVEDRMWDPKTLSETLHHLEDCPAQVILMSTIPHRGRHRTGWEYVSVSSEDSANA